MSNLDFLLIAFAVIAAWPWWAPAVSLLCLLLLWVALRDEDQAWDPLESTCRHASLSIL